MSGSVGARFLSPLTSFMASGILIFAARRFIKILAACHCMWLGTCDQDDDTTHLLRSQKKQGVSSPGGQ